jgi:hypothetical protein|nr:MAG TPA: hypothetical protein [Caudoviricetes sp.]
MKYFKLDTKGLISDFNKNKNAVLTLKSEILFAKQEKRAAIDEIEQSDWTRRIELLHLKQEEYQHYVNMVVLGFSAITEIERIILEGWIVEGKDDIELADESLIPIESIERAKNKALANFEAVINPL